MTILSTANICSQRRSAFAGTAAAGGEEETAAGGEEETADGGVDVGVRRAACSVRRAACGVRQRRRLPPTVRRRAADRDRGNRFVTMEQEGVRRQLMF